MLTLYYRPSCPFCRRVQAVIERLDLTVDLKDISEPEFDAELLEKGGQRMVPYLVDEANNVSMYESDDIVAYLQKQFGAPAAATKPRIHISDNACVSCEG